MQRALFSLLIVLGCLALAGCTVTEEKIELWKTTQNGPKKLAGTLIDPAVPVDLRAKAGTALVAINDWDLFREAFLKMDRTDVQGVILGMAPLLGAVVAGGGEATALTREQIDAKDGLFIMVEYADGEALAALRQHLIAWCTGGEYNQRAMAGQYNAKTIVRKLGAPAAEAMIPLLAVDEVTIEHVAGLIREVDDPTVTEKASAHWATELKSNVAKVGELHMVVAAIIGGEALADAMIDLATAKDLNAELQRFALRAYSMSFEKGHMKSSPARMERLFALGESTEYDKFHREETYLTIAQIGAKTDADRVGRLLLDKDFYLRLTGMRCMLRMDGPGQIKRILETKGLAVSAEEIRDVIDWAGKFPELREALRGIAATGSPFARGVAISALGAVGDATDAETLAKLAGDRTKLPKGFKHGTLGEAARAATEELKKRKG
jgi:hypothetical protein